MVPTAQVEGVHLSSSPTRQSERAAIRRELRARRRGLPAHEHAVLSKRLCLSIARTALFRHARRIAFYLPNDGEADLHPLIERARDMGKECFLPVLKPLLHDRLWFAPYEADSRMVRNRFGIPEPTVPWSHTVPPWGLDLLLTPLVGFDPHGNRLGMGGGFFDRTLAYLGARAHLRRPRLVGVAFELQKVERLPTEPWDVPLEGVATERRVYGLMR